MSRTKSSVAFPPAVPGSRNSPSASPRRWSMERRRRAQRALHNADWIADAVSESGVGWNGMADARRRYPEIDAAWREASVQQLERLEQMLVEIAGKALEGQWSGVDPGIKMGVSVGQWLLKNRLPVPTGPVGPARTAQSRLNAEAEPQAAESSAQSLIEDDARIQQMIADVARRLGKIRP